MPLGIAGTHYVIFDGVLLGIDHPVFQVHASYVSVSRRSSGNYWTYDVENDSFVAVDSTATGMAQAFIDATGIRNKQVGNVVNVGSLSKENVDYKAEDIR